MEPCEIQPPTPKRRRKQELIPHEDQERSHSPTTTTETVSRRGRPRKTINYYELANPITAEPYPEETDTGGLEPARKLPRSLKKDNTNNVEASLSIENGNRPNHVDNSFEGINPSEMVECNLDPESKKKMNKSRKQDDSSNKKYNKTGETVKMMNRLFTFFTTKEEPRHFETAEVNSLDVNSAGNKSVGPPKAENVDFDSYDNVTCAVCNASVDKTAWSHHKQRFHNNLAWRVGDPPLDLTDQAFVMHTLNMLYKKKKPLYCQCGEVKKSVVGFLSHQATCQKSDEQLESVKVACELCGKKMLPVSMNTHMKFVHYPKPPQEKATKNQKNEKKTDSSKRGAAKKALRLIESVSENRGFEGEYITSNLDFVDKDFARDYFMKQLFESESIECKFACGAVLNSFDEGLKHHSECGRKIVDGFLCKMCLFISKTLDEMSQHVAVTHAVSVDDGQDVEDGDVSFTEKPSAKIPSFVPTQRKTSRNLFVNALAWTLKFCEENFSDHVFGDLTADWPVLPAELAADYLPRMDESCDVARVFVNSITQNLSVPQDFKKYKLFETELHEDGKISIFCGGPIASMAWAPTPYDKSDERQILAVGVLPAPDSRYSTFKNYNEKCAIQFWDFGCLKNKSGFTTSASQIFNLAMDRGPVWHMEWCPSGCYVSDERVGLLAVTTSDPAVYIYSIPHLNSGLYYKPKPVFKLTLQKNERRQFGGMEYYPTKISWSKAKGHDTLAVGYTNGFIAIFNISTRSFLLRTRNSDGVTCVLPYKSFQGHTHAITVLSLYHLNEGRRWLLSGSVDRGVCIWDLDNHSYPIVISKKLLVTDGFWLTNWLSYVTAADEGSTLANVTATLKQMRDYHCDSFVNLTISTSTISALGSSDWLNGYAQGNQSGEIIAVFPHQMFAIPDPHKILKKKKLLFGYSCVMEKHKNPAERLEAYKRKRSILHKVIYSKHSQSTKFSKVRTHNDLSEVCTDEPILYEQANDRYALLFCDNKMESFIDFPESTSEQLSASSKAMAPPQNNQYPMNAVNKLAFNPNRQASLYLATGYQVGFVRVSWLQFLRNDPQID